MTTKILRNIFVSAGLLFASTQLAHAGMNDGVLSLNETPFLHPHPIFITFDAPGAGTDAGQGTQPYAINEAGAITGFYYDANSIGHGFLRMPGGGIITFDVPNSVNGTFPTSISPSGVITGYCADARGRARGFVRAPNGMFKTFDVPGAFFGTNPSSINETRAITGYYYDANFMAHGFLRARDGNFTTFDPPGSVGSKAVAISLTGAVTGSYDAG